MAPKKTIIPTQYYFTHTNAGARSSLAPPFPLQTGLGFYRDQLYLDYLYPLPATAFSPQKPGAKCRQTRQGLGTPVLHLGYTPGKPHPPCHRSRCRLSFLVPCPNLEFHLDRYCFIYRRAPPFLPRKTVKPLFLSGFPGGTRARPCPMFFRAIPVNPPSRVLGGRPFSSFHPPDPGFLLGPSPGFGLCFSSGAKNIS